MSIINRYQMNFILYYFILFTIYDENEYRYYIYKYKYKYKYSQERSPYMKKIF